MRHQHRTAHLDPVGDLVATEPGSAIEIGTDCMFSYDIDVRTGDSHSIIDPDTGLRINHARNVTIGDRVWIAAHVSVLKGGSIGAGSVVGTRSVVTHEIPPRSLAAGSPAAVIHTPVRWTRGRSLTPMHRRLPSHQTRPTPGSTTP